jgi:hypothetical protein
MEIERIRNNLYDKNGAYQRYSHARIGRKKENTKVVLLDAVTFGHFEKTELIDQQRLERLKLACYINALSDEDVNSRMKKFNRSFDDIESAIAEKLIMESL